MPSPKPVTKTNPKARAHEAYKTVPTKPIADDPGRYSKTPHDYGDTLIKPNAKGQTRLGGALQRDLVYWIERHTWGDAKRPEFAKLSLSTLAKLCGSDRRTVARSLADLTARGIIDARDRKGCGPTVAKMYKLTPDKWKTAPYYEPKAEQEAEIAEPEEDTEDTTAPETAHETEATVQPGKVSRPQSVAVAVTKDGPPVTIRMVYRSVDLPFPVSFQARAGRNGRMQINCRAVALHRFANPSPLISPVSVESAQVNAYREWLDTFLLNFWGKALDETLLKSIVSASSGAPIATFERIVLAKFKRSHSGARHSTGLLIELAKDAAKAWQAEQRAQKPTPAPRAGDRPPEPAETEEAPPAAPQALPCPACKGKGTKAKWSTRAGIYAERPEKCSTCLGSGRKAEQ
jgi:hypothetical protein